MPVAGFQYRDGQKPGWLDLRKVYLAARIISNGDIITGLGFGISTSTVLPHQCFIRQNKHDISTGNSTIKINWCTLDSGLVSEKPTRKV
jgi:hypothetical protein